MDFLRGKLRESSIHARVAPYVILLLLTFVQDSMGEAWRYWLYFAKLLVGGYCIWVIRDMVPELKINFSWEAVAVGILVCVIWVGLDPYYQKMSFMFEVGEPWNPIARYGEGSFLAYFFITVRTIGSATVIPPIEELLYRSFLYRWFVRKDFENMPFSRFHWLSFVVTALLFGFVHYQWLAGILCAMCYQALVIRKNRLGDAIVAHGVTNLLLGIWIYWKGAWQFW